MLSIVRFLLGLSLFLIALDTSAQTSQQTSCGQKAITEKLFKDHPELKRRSEQTEALLAKHNRQKKTGLNQRPLSGGQVVLPVVVHIIHNNGPENISDAQVLLGIQHLNEAFSKSSYYDNDKGVNTQIQFCMAQRSPAGLATNGITRNISPYTEMGGSEYYSDDLQVKNINRWNPDCYINIWLVKSIPGNVVGYAYLPSAAGTDVDGIIMEADYFGSSYPNDIVITHEMGHYLGLYHTFDGGCTNYDCVTDGDKVCDTPPDQSTAGVSCNNSMNSCTTDVLSGFNSDQNDLKEDFLDYGNFDCMKVFTTGQSERMTWFIQNVRYSLLNCKSCLPPCNSLVVAKFFTTADTIQVGNSINFLNQSVNANKYQWYIDGILADSTVNFNYLFSVAGRHVIKLIARSNDILCDDKLFSDTVQVRCPVKADFINPPGFITSGQTASFSNTSTNASAYTWKINGVVKSTATNFSYLFSLPGVYTVTLTAGDVLCSDSISSRISVYDSSGHIPPDQCMQTTFQKNYMDNSKDIWDLRPVKDGGYIMGGQYSVPFVDGYGGPFAAKINAGGSLQWAKYIMPFSWSRLERIKETSDGNYIGTGRFYEVINSQLIFKTLLLKLTGNGDLLWAKKFGIAGSRGETGIDVAETKDGGYAFCGSNNDDEWTSVNWMVAKTDINGNILWSKKLDNGFYERAYGIIANDDTLVVCGIRTISTGPRSEIVITKLSAVDGTVIQSKVFGVGGRSVETTSIFKIPGGYMVGAHSIADGFYYADMDIAVLQLDEDLNVVRAGKIAADIFASVHGGFAPATDGGFIAVQDGPNWSVTTNPTSMMMYKINGQWELEWAKQFPLNIDEGQTNFCVNGVAPAPGSGYIFGENFLNNSVAQYKQNVRIIKTDANGNTPGCVANDIRVEFVTPQVTTNNFTWSAVSNIIFNDPVNPSILNPVVQNAVITEVQRCETSSCNYLKIIGKDSVCNIYDTLTYKATRNEGCTSTVQWQYDSTMLAIVTTKDSLIKLVVKKPGLVKLYAKIITSCLVIQDSMDIYINDSNNGINLGTNIQLCKQSTVRLSAGNGFRSYRWNDGSTDSTLTAFNPGVYFVVAGDYCGNYYSDTLRITQAPDVALDLGPGLLKCDNDSVTITAPAAFEKYIWSPGYNISSTSESTVKVWPFIDTTYVLTVQVSTSCTVVDSVHITVLKSIPVNIGNDTSFCMGDYKVLKAPSNFSGYMWQDGSVNNTFTASAKGIYWLHALNANGCISKDTMQVVEVYPLPVLNLGDDGKVCLNADNTLNAGSGYISYLWQDGSTQSFFEINGAGKYWVTAGDGNRCFNTDTIIVTGLHPPPQGFLDASLEICENTVTKIQATGAWQSYLWSDNTTQPVFTVAAPGIYWLQVTDSFGCKGRDSIQVYIKQDCPKVIYFPSAFSPNDDNKNDFYKPFAGAPLEKFHLDVYNRMGQKIFESTDIFKGWDGKIYGHHQNPGTFVLYCTYKFYGEMERYEKRTFVLIR